MSEAYIVDAVRTPVGKRGGGLAGVHPADLGRGHAEGPDGADRRRPRGGRGRDLRLRRHQSAPRPATSPAPCWLAAGLPEEVPGTTVDRQCGSSQQAIHFAAQAVLSGTSDVIVAGGVQNMSMIPISSAMAVGEPLGFDDPFSGSTGWRARYGDEEVSQFRSAEMIAAKWGISREDMERFALESHGGRVRAIDEGRFERRSSRWPASTTDEGPRRGTRLEKMAGLPPLRPKAAGSPPPCRARSPTARPRC